MTQEEKLKNQLVETLRARLENLNAQQEKIKEEEMQISQKIWEAKHKFNIKFLNEIFKKSEKEIVVPSQTNILSFEQIANMLLIDKIIGDKECTTAYGRMNRIKAYVTAQKNDSFIRIPSIISCTSEIAISSLMITKDLKDIDDCFSVEEIVTSMKINPFSLDEALHIAFYLVDKKIIFSSDLKYGDYSRKDFIITYQGMPQILSFEYLHAISLEHGREMAWRMGSYSDIDCRNYFTGAQIQNPRNYHLVFKT